MLHNLGARKARAGLLGLLLDCHDKIRSFSALAVTLATRDGIEPAQAREGAAQARRYFVEALPRHVADEEESLLPRLRGRDPALDRALAQMHHEHEQHAALLAVLIDALDAVAQHGLREADQSALADVAPRLSRAFDEHLAREEQHIFSRIDSLLGAEEQSQIVHELRARRASAP
jgi:hemerythrin-like domain-containing protein